MDITQISALISQVGFPIFVAGYMLVKQSKDTENMTNILTKLETAIENLSGKINEPKQ
jgi:hypothetical protein